MGVPRETLGRLDKFSHETVTRGVAQTPVYANGPQAQPGRAYGMGSGAGANQGQGLATSIHRGSPPAPAYSGGSMGSFSGGGPRGGSSGGAPSMNSGIGRSGGGPPASAPAASHK